MEISVQHLDGVRFEVAARGHHAVSDQPADNGGQDTGMSPPEFLLASLGTCAGYYAVQYLSARGLPSNGLQVRVSAEKAAGPARLGSFRIDIRVPGLTDERHLAGVLRAARTCLIHNTLLQAPSIAIEVNAPETVHAG
jgi:uncharacterized OsmC-like protein